mmetsp:Transcript_46522/g.97758  ORF Transcript_46522/g.97758 Transcript_46522/m.97758 type:complete len:205 (-) Transcript_46522:173-787(-)
MPFLHPQLVHAQELFSLGRLLPLGANARLAHPGIHSEVRSFCLPQPQHFFLVEAVCLVLFVALEAEVAGVSVGVPLVTGLMIARAPELAGFNVHVDTAIRIGESLMLREAELLDAKMLFGRFCRCGFLIYRLHRGFGGDCRLATADMMRRGGSAMIVASGDGGNGRGVRSWGEMSGIQNWLGQSRQLGEGGINSLVFGCGHDDG